MSSYASLQSLNTDYKRCTESTWIRLQEQLQELSFQQRYHTFLSAFLLGCLLWQTGNQRLAYKLVDLVRVFTPVVTFWLVKSIQHPMRSFYFVVLEANKTDHGVLFVFNLLEVTCAFDNMLPRSVIQFFSCFCLYQRPTQFFSPIAKVGASIFNYNPMMAVGT